MWTRVQNKRSYRYFDFASWECFHGSDFNLNAMICRVPLEDGMFFSTFPILITRRNAFAETPYSSILSWIRCNTIFFHNSRFAIKQLRSSLCQDLCNSDMQSYDGWPASSVRADCFFFALFCSLRFWWSKFLPQDNQLMSCHLHDPCKTAAYWLVVLQVKFHNTKPTKVCNVADSH